MKTEREICNQCPDKYCINSNSRIGRVRAVINKETKELMEAPKTLIEDCPIRNNEVNDAFDNTNLGS